MSQMPTEIVIHLSVKPHSSKPVTKSKKGWHPAAQNIGLRVLKSSSCSYSTKYALLNKATANQFFSIRVFRAITKAQRWSIPRIMSKHGVSIKWHLVVLLPHPSKPFEKSLFPLASTVLNSGAHGKDHSLWPLHMQISAVIQEDI